jgi:hypothetical protein
MASYGRRTTIESNIDTASAVYKAFASLLKKLVTGVFAGKERNSHQVQILSGGKSVFRGVLQDDELKAVEGKITPAVLWQLQKISTQNPGSQLAGPSGADVKLLIDQKPVLVSQQGVIQTNLLPESLRQEFRSVGDGNSALPSQEPQEQVQRVFNPDRSAILALKQSLPNNSSLHKLVCAIRQGWDKTGAFLSPTQRSFSQDLRNLNALQHGKVCLSLLGDGPPGQRAWSGRTYSLEETKDGNFTMYALNRGRILEFNSQGAAITGKATPQDLKNLQTLAHLAQQNNLVQTAIPSHAFEAER